MIDCPNNLNRGYNKECQLCDTRKIVKKKITRCFKNILNALILKIMHYFSTRYLFLCYQTT